MLRSASRVLIVARRNVLLGNTYGRGASAWQAHWYLDQDKKRQEEESNIKEANQRQRDTMKKVGTAAGADYEVAGERWDDRVNLTEATERRDSSSLWEKAKGAAKELKDSVSDKMEAAKETAKDKYDDAKEAVGGKVDDFKDSMKSNTQRTIWPTDTTTKTNKSASRVGMNDEVLLSDLQGNLSTEDEIASNMAAVSMKSDVFHNKDNLGSARSTEELTIKDKTRDSKTAAAEHREKWKEERKLRNVTEGEADDFLEPDNQVNRQQQNLSDNLKDTKRAADQTWNKAGESIASGLDKTAKRLQSE